MTAPDNQQERLDDYLAGYVDGEGSFHVAVQRNPSTRFGWQLVPEFHVSQNPERASILELLRARLGCGRIRRNARAGGRDRSLVYVVRNRNDLLTKVIPFFRAHPILSEKRLEFETFAVIVTAMENREHLSAEGFRRLLDLAVNMNGGGEVTEGSIGHPESSEAIRRTRASAREEMVRPPWRHGEPGGTETTWPPGGARPTRR